MSLYLQVKERPDVGVYVKDLSAFVVNNADDMDRIMTLGNKNSAFFSLIREVKISLRQRHEYENEIFVCWHHHFLCSL